ncbi:MAG: radical SAM protein [Phycisphaerae bacterium]|nr:radical SAM protein [Phycisphaerae bacterium]
MTNYVVPLNIGYIGSSVKEKYAEQVDITIFKYPKQLEEALRNVPPDILGLSHYSWNDRLDNLFLKMVKQLNPDVITVMGGPHIRTDADGIKNYLTSHPALDYYIPYEGEEPFSELVGEILGGCGSEKPPCGCARIIEGELIFEPVIFKEKPKIIDLPSPYLSGLLDPFLADSKMIPLLETNRGCPFGCVYCTWGIAALSRVRQRKLDVIYEEIDYVAEKSVGQVNWIFCDANFGILPRDLDIAKRVRKVMDKKGYPINVTLWHSKNTGQRNVEIVKAIGAKAGNIAIQSADPAVLENCGRGNIKVEEIRKHITYYKDSNLKVATDILIGLPGENAESHLRTLNEAFDMGFDRIYPYNIRLLPGSRYETPEFRQKYGVKTKYRPIFGAYGVYDGEIVLEVEESVRATNSMTEEQMDDFKVLHWLIYFCWNSGVFKPVLLYAQKCGLNPAAILQAVSSSKNRQPRELFDDMKSKSMGEWFQSPAEMVEFYGVKENYEKLVGSFAKLNQLYIAIAYQRPEVVQSLQDEIIEVVSTELKAKGLYDEAIMSLLADFSSRLVCKDFLQGEFHLRRKYPGEFCSIVFNDMKLLEKETVETEFCFPEECATFCEFHLKPNGHKDLSLPNLARFLEIGGMNMLTNRVQVISN